MFIAHSPKEDTLCTRNFAPGCTVYGEKKISVDLPVGGAVRAQTHREALERRSSIDSGTRSVPSWEPLFWSCYVPGLMSRVELETSGWDLEARCCILAPLLERLCHMCPILLVQ